MMNDNAHVSGEPTDFADLPETIRLWATDYKIDGPAYTWLSVRNAQKDPFSGNWFVPSGDTLQTINTPGDPMAGSPPVGEVVLRPIGQNATHRFYVGVFSVPELAIERFVWLDVPLYVD